MWSLNAYFFLDPHRGYNDFKILAMFTDDSAGAQAVVLVSEVIHLAAYHGTDSPYHQRLPSTANTAKYFLNMLILEGDLAKEVVKPNPTPELSSALSLVYSK